MKKILILIVLMITMVSCSNHNPIEDFNTEETTMEQVKLSQQDTVTYNIQLSEDNEVLLINSETNLIEKRVSNYEGIAFVFFVLFIAAVILLIANFLDF